MKFVKQKGQLMEIKLSYKEVSTIIDFIKKYAKYEGLLTLKESQVCFLFSAFIKLLETKEQWEEAMKYSE